MTAVTADFLDYWTGAGARRWLASVILVLVLHFGVAGGLLFHGVPVAPPNPPQAPVLLDLPPLPAVPLNMHPLPASLPQIPTYQPTPPAQPTVQPQPQSQTVSPPTPVAPQSVSPPTPPVPEPETTSPLLPPSAEATVPRIIVPPPPEIADVPVPPKPVAKIPPVQTASMPALPVLPMPNAREDAYSGWKRKVVALLLSLNRLPPGLPIGERSATVDVSINVDRHTGHIVYWRIVRSSGYPDLDHAVRSLMRHADPLPPPPPGPIDILNSPFSFVLTVGYYDVPN